MVFLPTNRGRLHSSPLLDLLIAGIPLGMYLPIAITIGMLLWCAQPSLKRYFAPPSLDGAAVWGCAVIRVILTTGLSMTIFDSILSAQLFCAPSTSKGLLFAAAICQPAIYIVAIILVPGLMRFVTRQVDTSVMWYTVIWSKMRGSYGDDLGE
jgi:hypothetical protein